MKIRAVATGKDKKVPRGTPIEFTPEEKAPLAVMDGVKEYDFGGLIPVVTKADVQVTKQSHSPRGLQSKRSPYANNSYLAEGKVKVWFRDPVKDRMKPAKMYNFWVQFEDSKDSLGMPDLKITSFELE